MIVPVHQPATLEEQCLVDYRGGVWRDRILFDLIARDLPAGKTVLDIGCGRGFDGDVPLQEAMARKVGRFIGLEPDADVPVGACFDEVFRRTLEEAPLPAGSIDLAYAIMVLEHLCRPRAFFDKLYQVLAAGGVFWGMTVDSRHWFAHASRWCERLRIKEWYLNTFLGERGSARYENYPAYYRCNTPTVIRRLARRFRSCSFLNLSRVGQCNDYFPPPLHPLGNALDHWLLRHRCPGILLIVRLGK